MWLAFFALTIALFRGVSPHVVLAHQGEDGVVEINDQSFAPKELEVKAGQTVEFKNGGQMDHWPASNLHPTHRLYPEFDPKRPLSPGETWLFRFEKVGQWGFHDHLYPEFSGKIIVNGTEDKKEKKPIDIVAQIKQRTILFLQKFYYQLFPDKLKQDLAKVMAKLIADSGGGEIVDCHQEAHLVGRRAYELFGASVFRQGNSLCHSGFYHGAMEGFLAQKGTANLSQNIKNLCQQFSTSFGNFECLHGVGHGVLAFTNYDIPESIKICQKLWNIHSQSSCYGGMFMENIVVAEGNGARPSHETKWVSSDPHFPCNGIDQDFEVQSQCYYMQTSRMLNLFGHDYGKIIDQCLVAPNKMIGPCFQSLGRDIAGQSLRSGEKIYKVCQMVPGLYFDLCLSGGLNVVIDFWGESLWDQAVNLCKLVEATESKKYCYTVYSSRLKGLYGSDRGKIEAHCQLSEENFREICSKITL